MNPVALMFASGFTYLLGTCAVGAAVLLALVRPLRRVRVLIDLLALVGLLIALLASVPQPVWLHTVWVIVVLAALALSRRRTANPLFRAWAAVISVAAALFSASLFSAEVGYHRPPVVPILPGDTIHVIGDSISAGIVFGERTWPEVLAAETGVEVVNLAHAGATAASSLPDVAKIPEGKTVLIEIGGNDLLGGAKGELFLKDLDALLAAVAARNPRRMVIFQLPLPPFRSAYSRAQRELARKYHAALLPRSVLADVLGMEGGTVDGLHLSQKGHDALARAVARTLRVAPRLPESNVAPKQSNQVHPSR